MAITSLDLTLLSPERAAHTTEHGKTFHGAVNPPLRPPRSDHALSSIRGIQEDRRLAIDKVLASSDFAQEHKEKVGQLWLVARVDTGRDQGVDIKEILPLLEKRPELLDQLHKVATSDTLFGQVKTDSNAQAFEKMRREFLAELIGGAVDSQRITQGPGAMCTAAAMIKTLPPEELIRLGTGFALDGHVTTAGGKEMIMRPEFFARAEIAAHGKLQDIKSRRPSAGILMLLDGVIELGVPNVEGQSGSFWWQYTDAWRHLRGHESACAGRDAKILVDQNGQAVRHPAKGAQEMSQMDYLVHKLESTPAATTAGGVLIDTKWDHSAPGATTGGDALHARHMLRAVGVEVRDGVQYIKCENPMGDLVDTSKSAARYAEYYPPGTILGDRDKFWFETGENGIVFIREDVLRANLQTVLVDYNDRFDIGSGGAAVALGAMEESGGSVPYVVADSTPGPIHFVSTEDILPKQAVKVIAPEQPKAEVVAEENKPKVESTSHLARVSRALVEAEQAERARKRKRLENKDDLGSY